MVGPQSSYRRSIVDCWMPVVIGLGRDAREMNAAANACRSEGH